MIACRLDKEMSKKTREPVFFDKHFTKNLKLLHVTRFPTIIHDLIAIVDKNIAEGVQSLPLFNTGLVSWSSRYLVDEKGVDACSVLVGPFEFKVEPVFTFVVTEQDIEYNIVSSWKIESPDLESRG